MSWGIVLGMLCCLGFGAGICILAFFALPLWIAKRNKSGKGGPPAGG